MSDKSWQQGLEGLLRSEQRHSFYEILARTNPEGCRGLQDMISRPRPQLQRAPGGMQDGSSRGQDRPASGPSASSWEASSPGQAPPGPNPSVVEDVQQPPEPTVAPPMAPHANPNPQKSDQSDPHVNFAVRWCGLSGLGDLAEWVEKLWLRLRDPQVAAEVVRMHVLVSCLRLDPESTKSIVQGSREFQAYQALSMVHRASRLFYDFAYKAQSGLGAEEITPHKIFEEATKFLKWIQSELRQSPYASLADRLEVLRDGPFQSDKQDCEGEPHGQVKLLSFFISSAPPDNQSHRAITTSAHQGRYGAR